MHGMLSFSLQAASDCSSVALATSSNTPFALHFEASLAERLKDADGFLLRLRLGHGCSSQTAYATNASKCHHVDKSFHLFHSSSDVEDAFG